MAENSVVAPVKRAAWIVWMHVAGIAYAASLWVFVVSFFVGGGMFGFALLGAITFTVATFAFVGGWGRYMATKR